MQRDEAEREIQARSFSTLQCGSWIDALQMPIPRRSSYCFSTLQCGSWIDAVSGYTPDDIERMFQYPSMRVVD